MSRTCLVLASGSPSRLALLRRAGVNPVVLVSGIDESPLPGETIAGLTLRLAREKAAAVAGRCPQDALVIGCDSMLEIGNTGYGKPHTPDRAVGMWQLLAGHSGVFRTGHCVLQASTGRQEVGGCATVVRFGRPSPEEVAAYVGTGEPLQAAGAFRIDRLGGWFVESVDGEPSNLLGLSLPLLRRLLAKWSVRLPGLWPEPARVP